MFFNFVQINYPVLFLHVVISFIQLLMYKSKYLILYVRRFGMM